MKKVVELEWTEHERGWGQRPDGYTYHLTMEDAKKHIANHWAKHPVEVPNEYSSPETPKWVEVDELIAILIQNTGVVHSHKRLR